MKFLFILAVTSTLSVLFVTCQKDKNVANPQQSLSIVGTWELRQVSGGWAGTTNYTPGNGNLLKFTNSTYEKYTNWQLVASGNYVIVPDGTVTQSVCLVFPTGQFTDRIVYDNNYTTQKQFLQLTTDTLKFVSGNFCLDAGQKKNYKKL